MSFSTSSRKASDGSARRAAYRRTRVKAGYQAKAEPAPHAADGPDGASNSASASATATVTAFDAQAFIAALPSNRNSPRAKDKAVRNVFNSFFNDFLKSRNNWSQSDIAAEAGKTKSGNGGSVSHFLKNNRHTAWIFSVFLRLAREAAASHPHDFADWAKPHVTFSQ
ncbi:uncharacterized protein AMSG_07595 [Thecamonas trahens ATCC 50062]|uniref:Uncharacterized protein n=1 Tax=Thecamonas trahens ATCC 50062 TaxID=461836 RepID=A0A0L0DGT6_THETB|nr:hypothetical protein AMSG_07595 [Thecamonas trahens ATCC 50062]KNC51410.1 hypothetical protein AMSG_07595 [Thecamonas trahens ATCC 50062]|eukprot:XP_013756077.1 hypothetical protein AMSG_07595 [Thecamonas trahens ATCC 50062]